MKKVFIKSKVDITWNFGSGLIIFRSYIGIVLTRMLTLNEFYSEFS